MATHPLATGKGQTIRNTAHYRDRSRQIEELEATIAERIGADLGERLCARLRASDPRIYRDQVAAVSRMLEADPLPEPEVLERLAEREGLTATRFKDYLEASQRAAQRGRDARKDAAEGEAEPDALAAYADLGQPAGHEEVTQ